MLGDNRYDSISITSVKTPAISSPWVMDAMWSSVMGRLVDLMRTRYDNVDVVVHDDTQLVINYIYQSNPYSINILRSTVEVGSDLPELIIEQLNDEMSKITVTEEAE